MSIITVASPDKISISMFLSFMKFCLVKDYLVGATHSLMLKEEIETYIKSIMGKSDKVLFSYYAKKKINVDPMLVIPEGLLVASDMVIWINLYSTEWVVVKDASNQAPYYIDRWNKNIERHNA
jgi:hypothetical protein